jgi:hypothetical protein
MKNTQYYLKGLFDAIRKEQATRGVHPEFVVNPLRLKDEACAGILPTDKWSQHLPLRMPPSRQG